MLLAALDFGYIRLISRYRLTSGSDSATMASTAATAAALISLVSIVRLFFR